MENYLYYIQYTIYESIRVIYNKHINEKYVIYKIIIINL